MPYECHVFRAMSQGPEETIEQFITRLRQQAEDHIRGQGIEKCSSHSLRRKLLEKGKTLTLTKLQDIAHAMEDSERQA